VLAVGRHLGPRTKLWRAFLPSDEALEPLPATHTSLYGGKGLVTNRPLKLQPTWSDVNDNIASFGRTAVLQLLRHRYGDRQ
jgi:hypothetical protein